MDFEFFNKSRRGLCEPVPNFLSISRFITCQKKIKGERQNLSSSPGDSKFFNFLFQVWTNELLRTVFCMCYMNVMSIFKDTFFLLKKLQKYLNKFCLKNVNEKKFQCFSQVPKWISYLFINCKGVSANLYQI